MTDRRRVVALAGAFCSPDIFDPLAHALADSATLDAPSWMTSSGPWDIESIATRIAERIEVTGEGAVTLIGHSTGGAIALQVALDHPHLVDALVLVATGPNMHAHGDVSAIIARIEDSWGRSLFESVLDRSFMTPLDPSVRVAFLEYAERIDPRAASEVLISQRDIDFQSRLGEIDCRCAVIHGSEDPTRTTSQATAFAQSIPGSELYLLRSGHSPMFEQSGDVAEIVRKTWL